MGEYLHQQYLLLELEKEKIENERIRKEKISDFFKQIISIEDYSETHCILRFMGIKLKFPKREYAKRKKENPYYYYKKNKIDIRTLPTAEGQTREIQLGNLGLLKELDYVCKQAGLKYWLDFGTALGAIRHKGYIPWDDDIDTGMLKEDYEKIIDAFKTCSRDSDIFADYFIDEKYPYKIIIKVQHKKCPHLFVDIFPYEYFGEKLTRKEQCAVTKSIEKCGRVLKRECSKLLDIKKNLEIIEQRRNEIIFNNNRKETKKSDLIWGDFMHNSKSWIYSYETVFPLKEIEFEGRKFPCMNKLENFMEDIFGNYMDYPSKIGFGHSSYIKIDDEEKKIIQTFISKKEEI